MKLRITVPVTVGSHDSDEVIAAVEVAAARKANAWTQPAYIGTESGQHIYLTDALPKPDPSIVGLHNIAPTLLPASTT